MFVPGRAGQEISVFAGRQFVNRYTYPQCYTVARGGEELDWSAVGRLAATDAGLAG